ncbi:MAG TPA: single-stranded-DNA-specific exonuclease RecJ [Candidatus Sulfotelmatobacter sp.]|nr:single-stranded-DNA-specific exonuclease RecJ [Candidatus Sulfotelmatobacter sp.]
MIIPTQVPQWVHHPRRDPERAAGLARALGAPLPVGHALVHRGVSDLEDARRFLDPALEDLHDPLQLLDLELAVQRIRAALDNEEPILIHGDYDVDGITSTFLLFSVLRELGGRVECRIPHRTRDGYGLSLGAIDEAERRGCRLIVTVDCGITAVEPVRVARERGIETVIIDHHEVPAALPEAAAVVNPLRRGCPYPFKPLAGVGVTFKLVEALLRRRGGLDRARDFLDVVALGTIADVVPLVGENRVLARLGLERLNQSPRLGLRALIEVAGLAGRRISSGQVAFVLAPRINAAGRMGNAEQGLRLLLAREPGEARVCAESLEEDNDTRRRYDEAALLEASQRVESELDWPNCSSILLWSEQWHPGVIGIVASRLVERYQRPTILVAVDGDRGRGSGRSLPGLDLNHLLSRCADLLEGYGGHAFAAGLTVRRDRLPELRQRIEALARETLAPEDCVPRLTLDAEVRLAECDFELIEWLERLSPHGLDNPEPVLCSRGLAVAQVGTVGGGKHLRLTVRDASDSVEAIGFGMGARAVELTRGGGVDLAFVPTRNEWMGQARVQLKLKGMQPA